MNETYVYIPLTSRLVGEKVTYITPFKKEHGIIKSLSDEKHVFVVYNCGGDWDNYQGYTGARTETKDLVLGWL